MAGIPLPRSYSSIVSDILDGTLSKLPVPGVRVGSAILSIAEAAAQSDLRSSQDTFNLLNATSLDRATGLALDRIGASEDCPRITQSPSTGKVDFTDTSFSKISTKIFQGQPAPIIGATTIYVTSAASFTPTGSIYIGRGTTNYEGPIAYTSAVNNTNYWTITLATGTTKYHNLGEGVVLAQGGDRTINAGTIVQTSQANVSSAVQFSTLYKATIPDGETSITGVDVVAKTAGIVGNVIAGSIVSFVSAPFAGAKVTNPSPFSNGLPNEDDNTYKERIRSVIASKSRATPLAIKTGITGITSLNENKRVVSCSIVSRASYPTTIYVDDGTGYEEASQGIALETLVDQALGGEQYFQLVHGRPVTKAYVATSLTAPFSISPASRLSVKVGGVLTEHIFTPAEFRSISNASSYEVVASINADVDLKWSARTIDSGSRVAIFAKTDTEEDVEVVSPSSGTDSNLNLGFGAGRVDTIRLYKNDLLLSKDGQLANLNSTSQGLWQATSSGETIVIKVDGIDVALTPPNTYVINDIDFVNAGTPYRTVASTNSLSSWAAVLNLKIPGITASVLGGAISITSNRGRKASASVSITGGTLVAKGIFQAATSNGKSFDYTLDRNLGQIRLEDSQVLHAGDRLTVGSYATRAFLESTPLTTVTISGASNTTVTGESGAELWFVVDGAAKLIPTRIGTSTPITFSSAGTWSGGQRVRISHTLGTLTLFENASVGDWLIVNDSSVNIANRGAFRIVGVVSGGISVDIERSPSPTYTGPFESISLATGSISVVRTDADLQRVYIPNASNYTAASLATTISSQLSGATAQTYRTTQFRVRTNSFLSDGDIALVAINQEGAKLGLTVSAQTNQTSHLASVEAGNMESGTPSFDVKTITGSVTASSFDFGSSSITSDSIVVGLRPLTDGTGTRFSNAGHISTIDSISGSVYTTRRPTAKSWLVADRIYSASPFAMTADDEMSVVVDGDTSSKRFILPMFRRVSPASPTYGITNDFVDADLAGVSLARAFGTGFDWKDFAVFMSARSKSHAGPDTNKTILWRYKRLGLEGNRARIQYVYQTSPNQPAAVTWSSLSSSYTDIKVAIPSGAQRIIPTITNNTRVGTIGTSVGGGLYDYQYVYNLVISTAKRDVALNYTGASGSWSIGNTITGAVSGATGVIAAGAGTGSGTLTITGVSGTFIGGENLNVAGTPRAVASGSQYGLVTLTLTLPPNVTDMGLGIGDQVHIEYNGTGTGAGFITGNRFILSRSATTIIFAEGTVAIAPTSNVGSVSFDTGDVKITGGGISVGDIQSFLSASSLPTAFKQALKISAVGSGYLTCQSPVTPPVGTVLTWSPIVSVANISWFQIGSNTITAIANAVNSQANCPVKALAVGDGLGDISGTISAATYESIANGGLGSATPDTAWYYFSDGVNWVRSNTTPPNDTTNFSFTFKEAPSSGLATNSDWQNETIRLVPITAKNIADYLASSGPGGLYANSEIVIAGRGSKPQITTITAGSGGSIQVQGGTANSLTATVKGQASIVVSSYSVVTTSTSDTIGLSAGHWVRVQNAIEVPRARIDASTDLESISADGTVVFANTGTKAWSFSVGSAPLGLLTWQIEKHGNFVAYQYVSGGSPSLAGASEGDYIHVASTGTINLRNQGLFRIVRINDTTKTFWIENANAVEENASCSIAFLNGESILPGDKISINTSLWGSGNLGTWTIASIDLSTFDPARTNNQWTFKLDVSKRAPSPIVAPGPSPLGTSSNLVQVIEGKPSSLIKRVYSIVPSQADANLTDIKFDTSFGSTRMSEAAGTVISSLDKLAFNTGVADGVDGYQHSTGLIEEANKVGYGVESDPNTYPGLIAGGTSINIQGPLIRRVVLSLALRVRSGVSSADIANAVRSAVASYINRSGVGKQLSLSEVVSAAQSVNGVVSVTILSPNYAVGSDLISIQPFEKALVLNLDSDIQISFVGE